MWCFDATKTGDKVGVLVGFVVGEKNLYWQEEAHLKERRDAIVEFYCQVFKDESARDYLGDQIFLVEIFILLFSSFFVHKAYHEKVWSKDEFTGHCVFSLPPGCAMKYSKEMGRRVGNIHFGGTENAVEWSGYMEGAIQAGERAAHQVVDSNWRNLGIPAPGAFKETLEPPANFVVEYSGPKWYERILPGPKTFLLILALFSLYASFLTYKLIF